MTRAQRRARSRVRRLHDSLGGFREPFAFGLPLTGNPNSGKRRVGKLSDAFLQELAQAETRAYAPLTVSHPTLDSRGRRNPRTRTSYTV